MLATKNTVNQGFMDTLFSLSLRRRGMSGGQGEVLTVLNFKIVDDGNF